MIILKVIPNAYFPKEGGEVWFKQFSPISEILGVTAIEITRKRAEAARFETEEEARKILDDRYDEFVIECD